tara:strand:- start:2649 stop:2861 length:213 start_codon:yes stop_codon:yes gene_type:complete
MALQEITFTARIMVDENDDINGEHLCEEIQAYLNSAYYYDEPDDVERAEVTGWNICNPFKFNSFISKEVY